MMTWGHHNWSAWNWALMGMMMVVFWSLIAAEVTALVRAPAGRQAPTEAGGDAQQVLDQRLARGEISQAEYARTRALLHRL